MITPRGYEEKEPDTQSMRITTRKPQTQDVKGKESKNKTRVYDGDREQTLSAKA